MPDKVKQNNTKTVDDLIDDIQDDVSEKALEDEILDPDVVKALNPKKGVTKTNEIDYIPETDLGEEEEVVDKISELVTDDPY